MQGFSAKILPAGLEIFAENRRLDLAFPSNPGITFAPRTEMTAWCGPLKGAKMEVNGSGGRLDRKTSKEKSVKKGKRQIEKGHSRKRETGQTTGKEVWFCMFGRTCPVGRIKSFFPVCLPCVWRLVPFMDRAVRHGFPLTAQRNSKKEKSSETRKSTSLA